MYIFTEFFGLFVTVKLESLDVLFHFTG